MAEAMQGIMSLPEGQQEPMGQIDPTQFSPVVESYARSNPREFNNDILGGMAQADPAAVDEFVRGLAPLNLPPDVIDAMQMMIDGILAEPENYTANRAELIKEGVPEDLLPEQFDPAFFAALNMALDQIEMNADQGLMVPGFADGGIINVREIASQLAKMGRNGDTMLAHITPAEARMLRRRGGSGTINPDTGLPEFFLKKAVKAVGSVFKGAAKIVTSAVKEVGRAVKKIASSPIGKIALTAAAVYFMGPLAGKLGIQNAALANGVNTFAGSTLVNVASGQKIGDAIKDGLVSGVVAGGTTALFDGDVFGRKAPAPEAPIPDVSKMATENVMVPSDVSANFRPPANAASFGPQDLISAPSTGSSVFDPSTGSPVGSSFSPSANRATFQGLSPYRELSSAATPGLGLTDLFQQGKELASSGFDAINPFAIKANAIPAAQAKAVSTYNDAIASNLPKSLAESLAKDAYKEALPGMLGTYGPLAATGLAGAYAMGAFDPPKVEAPENIDEFKTTGQDLLEQDPEKFGLNFGGATTSFAPNPFQDLSNPGQVNFTRADDPFANRMSSMPRRFDLPVPFNPYQTVQQGIGAVQPQRLAKGGTAEFPRKTGPINGPGTGTSDSVPAMLSDGEFVFTAKAVRAMGQGSRRKGAKRMYAMMKQLERKSS